MFVDIFENDGVRNKRILLWSDQTCLIVTVPVFKVLLKNFSLMYTELEFKVNEYKSF